MQINGVFFLFKNIWFTKFALQIKIKGKEKKMKKQIGLFTAILFAVSTLMVGCKAEVHTHTFASEWTSDATNHWHSATCGHTTEVSGKAEHSFGDWTTTTEEAEGNKERSCTICGYKTTNCIITFNANGGSLIGNHIQLVKYGDKLNAPPEPTREGYNFIGWYKSNDGGITFNDQKWIFSDEIRILVFCQEGRVKEALDAGATYAGSDEYIEKVKGGWEDFDIVIATPDMMKDVGRLGMVLGRKGLMPNPKTGTVTNDLETAVKKIICITNDLELYAMWDQQTN